MRLADLCEADYGLAKCPRHTICEKEEFAQAFYNHCYVDLCQAAKFQLIQNEHKALRGMGG